MFCYASVAPPTAPAPTGQVLTVLIGAAAAL